MRPHWFSVYTGADWKPQHGYNELFKRQIEFIRAQFALRKAGPGVDVGTNRVVSYNLQGRQWHIAVTRNQWSGYRTIGSGSTGYITPQFLLSFVVYDDKGNVRYNDAPLLIEFEPNYPETPPRFRLQDGSTNPEPNSYSGGWFCIMGGISGRRNSNEWNPAQGDTILVALSRAFDWVVSRKIRA